MINIIQLLEIGNLKATKDVYDAQLTIFSNELVSAQVRRSFFHLRSLLIFLISESIKRKTTTTRYSFVEVSF